MKAESVSDVDRVLAAGRATYPDILAGDAICALLEPHAEAALASQKEDRAADLFLAMACAAGDATAIACLDASLPAIVRPALAKLGTPPSDDDEIIQRLRVALFTRDKDRPPGIANYSARGALRGYVRAVAVKLALRRLEREEMASPRDDSDVLGLLPCDGDSPEVRVLKERCRGDVRVAFAAAVAGLEPRDRTVLRQHYVDGLSIDALSRLHSVHRATGARWIESARGAVLAGIRQWMRTQRGLGHGEVESVVALASSQLELSLSRHLKSTSGDSSQGRC